MGNAYSAAVGDDVAKIVRVRLVGLDNTPVTGASVSCVVRNSTGASVSSGTMAEIGAGWYRPGTYFLAAAGAYTVEFSPPDGYLADADTVTVSASSPATPAAVAAAVRAELTTELGCLDAAVSSRLSTSSYVAPDNNTIGFLRDLAAGSWRIDAAASQLICLGEDGETEVARFDLEDHLGNPSPTHVFRRTRVS